MKHEFSDGRCCYSCGYIYLPCSTGLEKFYLCRIHFLEADDSYVHIHFKDSDKVSLVTRSLKEVERELDVCEMVRCHASYIVNLNYVKRYVKGDPGHVLLENGQTVNVSDKYRNYLLARMHHLPMQSPTFEDEKKNPPPSPGEDDSMGDGISF